MNRRTRTLLVGAAPILALAAVLSSPSVPVPFAAEGPGPLFDVLGDIEGQEAVEVTGGDPDPSAGELNMTTVAVAHRLSLAQVMGMWADPDQRVVPIESVFPPGLSQEDVKERNALMFTDSEANATASALRQLGLPIEVTVALVTEGGAAEGALEEGDVLRTIDGDEVDRPETLQRTVAGHAPGDRVVLDVVRDGEPREIEVELGGHPDDENRAFLGIGMAAQPTGDVEVEYNVSGVGGPSAGLMLSLAVVDKLSPGDLTEGRHIAGTGSIDGVGVVGPIGGITHKIAAAREDGAEVFLVPTDNCSEALTADAGDMKLISVGTLDAAVDALGDPNAAPTCG
ncbi:signaling protein [Corynebacterium xerosis]|uniref:endopeptidase La n=1 Tax=Corynebacterium xerosis TaxID=1725 RepID=A0A2N6T002_9CORY|nr:PDZ domain-containing protein [Corynebacterium xerosis]PMC62657.1 signaling protein [Corynebacterium xerosis]